MKEPSKLEMQVLAVLWQRGPSTVRDVLDAIPDGKTRAYTTILTVMQVMERKGLLAHTDQGNAHLYTPKVTRRAVVGPLLRGLVSQLFGGSPAAAMQHLLNENDVTHEELAEIKRLVETHENGKPSVAARKKGRGA